MKTLTHRSEFPQATRIDLLIMQGVAATPDLTVYLTPSRGRRKAGRPTNYFLVEAGKSVLATLQAASDTEATDKANAWLAAHRTCGVAA